MELGSGPGREPELALGEQFAGHRIEAVLGRGGMGVVYRARNLALERDRALKVLAPGLSADSRFRERFRRESRLAASLEHPNVLPVHDAGEHEGLLYLAMRLVEGPDLRELVAADGPLEPERVARIVAGVAAALDTAHRHGLVHRDVKPANVLLEGEGGQERVFLTDFGISRMTRAGETLTGTGEIVGSADFISPEQVAGDPVDARADVYSLAALAHYALTAEPPFRRENELATLFAHGNAPRPRPSELRPSLSAGVDDAIARGMAVDPATRPASAGDFAAALAAALGGAQPATGPTRVLPRPRLRPSRAALIAGILLAIAATAAALVLSLGDNEDGAPAGAPAPDEPEPERRLRASEPITAARGPTGLTVADGRVWVAAREAGEVVSIEPAARQRTTIDLPGATSVAIGFGSLWAVSSSAGTLTEIDLDDDSLETFTVGVNPSDVAVDDRWVWVTLEGDQRVARIDPATGATESVPVGVGPRAVATGEGAVWVTNIEEGSVSKLDPDEPAKLGSAVEVGGRPSDIAVGGGSVWAVDVNNGRLIEIEPGQPSDFAGDADEISGFQLPRGVKTGFGSVWVANAGDSTLLRIDPSTGETTARVEVGENPSDVAIGDGFVWTASEDDGTVTRVDPGQSP